MRHPDNSHPFDITLAITGASGAVLGRRALQLLELDSRVGHINLILSAHSFRVLQQELDIEVASGAEYVESLLGKLPPKIQVHENSNIGANVASGSYPSDAMLIMPCSMGTLAAIAHGMSDNLIERAADVCLKERRKLVLSTREAPLSRINIQNMLAATDAGATIFPVVPAFYDRASSIEASVDQYVGRVLAFLGLRQERTFVWTGTRSS